MPSGVFVGIRGGRACFRDDKSVFDCQLSKFSRKFRSSEMKMVQTVLVTMTGIISLGYTCIADGNIFSFSG